MDDIREWFRNYRDEKFENYFCLKIEGISLVYNMQGCNSEIGRPPKEPEVSKEEKIIESPEPQKIDQTPTTVEPIVDHEVDDAVQNQEANITPAPGLLIVPIILLILIVKFARKTSFHKNRIKTRSY